MLLIIFFMTTAQFVKMTQAEVDLPQQRGEEIRPEAGSELIINIDAPGRYIVAGEIASLDVVRRKVAYELAMAGTEARGGESREDRLRVVIRADRNASADVLNRLIAALSDLGVKSSALGVEVR